MSKQKAKGTAFERMVTEYLSRVLDAPEIERRTVGGTKDRGDIAGVFFRGQRVVLECKNTTRPELPKWLRETEVERINDGAEYGFVVHKRRGCGAAQAGETYVTCTLETLAAMIAGGREFLQD